MWTRCAAIPWSSSTSCRRRCPLFRRPGNISGQLLSNAYVDGMIAKRLMEAVRSGDLDRVESMLRAQPELANMGLGQDEWRALHYAVLGRSAGMTRLLMKQGADARAGIYPHRDATTPLTLAEERGYEDLSTVIREEEQWRREAPAGKAAAAPDQLFLVANWESGRALEILRADSAGIVYTKALPLPP